MSTCDRYFFKNERGGKLRLHQIALRDGSERLGQRGRIDLRLGFDRTLIQLFYHYKIEEEIHEQQRCAFILHIFLFMKKEE